MRRQRRRAARWIEVEEPSSLLPADTSGTNHATCGAIGNGCKGRSLSAVTQLAWRGRQRGQQIFGADTQRRGGGTQQLVPRAVHLHVEQHLCDLVVVATAGAVARN